MTVRPAVRRLVEAGPVVDTGRRSVDRVGYIYAMQIEVKHVVPNNAVRILPPTYEIDANLCTSRQCLFLSLDFFYSKD